MPDHRGQLLPADVELAPLRLYTFQVWSVNDQSVDHPSECRGVEVAGLLEWQIRDLAAF